jgi:large subunit ribosomal protein L17
MRHRVRGKKLNRTSAHRTAMLRNMAAAVIRHGKIVTTVPKAKAVKPFVEKLVTLGKVKTLHRYRRALQLLGDEDAVAQLFTLVGPHFAERPGGYTRIIRLPKPRLGDNASTAVLEFVDLTIDKVEQGGGRATASAAKQVDEKAATA